jgi:hypothetical protein
LGSASGARLSLSSANLFGTEVVHAVQTRSVDLGKLHSELKGVVALAQEPVMVGASGGRAAVLGAMPQTDDTDVEVRAFVDSLLAHGRIKFAKPKKRAAAVSGPTWDHHTHVIRAVGGKKVLQRARFQCADTDTPPR